MFQSQLFPKTQKIPPKSADSINHKLLVRAGFIDQLMTGSFTLLPLGFRVVTKINNLIREELDAIGGQEMLMPLLHPKSIWNESGRWEKAKEVMFQFKDNHGKEYALSFTHEEVVMDLIRKHIKSYKDLPLSVYHFSTKFRNEKRARSGIIRGREFMMNDLYSAHVSEEDMLNYYFKVVEAYKKIFKRLGFVIKVTEASGGVFTQNNTHEFQVLSENGEDTIFYCDKCDWGQNKEIFAGSAGDSCPKCKKGEVIKANSIEVGNTFPLGTWYADRMKVFYADERGMKKPVSFASYGIGSTRVLGALVEVSHDDKGIIWFPQVSPFDVHLIDLSGDSMDDKRANEIYSRLFDDGIDVLYDDRQLSAGEKLADADLIGIPFRLVVSLQTGDKIEVKKRNEDETQLLSYDELLKMLSG